MQDFKKIILGTMNFGIQNDMKESNSIMSCFLNNGFDEIDTAYVYNNGKSELILGDILKKQSKEVKIATKVNPKVFGNLNRDSILKQFTTSLDRMKISCADILYIHFPDQNTSLDEIYSTTNDLHKQGRIKELGLSNHSANMVEEICKLCIRNNWLLPTVYEGMYNSLARDVEDELFDVLRKYNIRFYAYNPLAGGLLTGKYLDYNEKPLKGRFQVRPNYLNRYWKKTFFDNINIINNEIKNLDLTLAEASLMWLSYYSKLDFKKGDGIIIGVSKVQHLRNNIQSILYNRLNEEIVKMFDSLWENIKDESPKYYRYYDEGI